MGFDLGNEVFDVGAGLDAAVASNIGNEVFPEHAVESAKLITRQLIRRYSTEAVD